MPSGAGAGANSASASASPKGYATPGQIGFADRSVCNLAARLCGEAKDGQILLAGRVAAAVEGTVALEQIGTLSLKGLTQPVSVFNVLGERAAAAPHDTPP